MSIPLATSQSHSLSSPEVFCEASDGEDGVNLIDVHGYAAWAEDPDARGVQFQGNNSRRRFYGMSAMRAKTSASQAFGSMSLRRAVMMSAPSWRLARPRGRSQRTTCLPSAIARSFCPCRAGIGSLLPVSPYFGRKVLVRRIAQRATGQFLSVQGPAGIVVLIASWMLDPVVCAGMTIGAPRRSGRARRIEEGIDRYGHSRTLPERCWNCSGGKQ